VEAEAQARRLRDDDQRVMEAQLEYIKAAAIEQRRWFARQSEMCKARLKSGRDDLETVRTHFQDECMPVLEEVLEKRSEQHLALLEPIEQRSREERDVLCPAAQARQEWTNEECKMVVLEMRKEWRQGQRRVLQQLAHELRAERKAAAEALERQITMSSKAVEAVRASWAGEIQQSRDEIERVSETYKNALRTALEAKLREARQHAREQAEFFQREITQAHTVEQADSAWHTSQLRKMRIAMLKWRHDYMRDAKRKAEELVAHRILAKIGNVDLESEGDTPVSILGETEQASHATKVNGKKKMQLQGPLEGQGSNNELDIEMRDSRVVLAQLWEHFPVEEEEVRDFLRRLESLVPYSEEVLRLYENHLAEHGVLSALDCADSSVDGPISSESPGL